MHPPTDEDRESLSQPGPNQVLSDQDVVERVLSGETSLFEIIMQRYNQRLFRTIRAMVPDDAEAEDVLQESYVRAYHHLRQFEGRARFSTWLTRIAIHEVMARRRKSRRFTSLEDHEHRRGQNDRWHRTERTPEEHASSSELRCVLERAIRQMPESLRLVFMLREVEGLDTGETAHCLEISAGSVKVRLFRARSQLRSSIDRELGANARQLHQFAGERCDNMVSGVLNRISVSIDGTKE